MIDRIENQEVSDERIQTGIRLNKNMVKVLKGLAEYYEMPLGDLIELIITESFEGTTPFSEEDIRVIDNLTSIYGLKKESATNDHEIDTVIVPSAEENFKNVFLGQNLWYSISIADSKLTKIKYCAVYRTAPTSAITHIAEVKNIQRYQNTNKYELIFKSPARELPNPIKCTSKKEVIQSRQYANYNRMIKAKTISEIYNK